MKSKDMKNLSIPDLNKKLEEVKLELVKHNSQISTGTTPKSPGQIKGLKKTVARIKTEIKVKESQS